MATNGTTSETYWLSWQKRSGILGSKKTKEELSEDLSLELETKNSTETRIELLLIAILRELKEIRKK